MISPSNVVKHELIGLTVKVVNAKNSALVGIQGKVVDETRNTLVIETSDGEKTVLKEQVQLETVVADETVLIDGKTLVARSEDRLKK